MTNRNEMRDDCHGNMWTIAMVCAVMCGLCLCVDNVAAAPQGNASVTDGPQYRELYVPASELNTLLEAAPQRAMITRGEFETLVEKIRQLDSLDQAEREKIVASVDSVLKRSEYDVQIADGRAEIRGTLTFDVVGNDAIAVPLQWTNVALREATLDEQPAAFVTLENGERFLLIPANSNTKNTETTQTTESMRTAEPTQTAESMRTVRLNVVFVAALETTAVLQTLRCAIPEAAVRQTTLAVPGDVELKRGAGVLSQNVVENSETLAKTTHFTLLPERGNWDVTLTLNSHTRRGGTRMTAKSVQVAEVTQGYERLYATFSMQVLRQAQQRFQFVLPEGFETDSVELLESIAPADDETATATLASWRMIEPSDAMNATNTITSTDVTTTDAVTASTSDSRDDTETPTDSSAKKPRLIEVVLREPAIGTLVFGMTAVRSQAATLDSLEPLYRTDVEIANGKEPARWKFPAICPMETESHNGIFGVILEDSLELYQLETTGLISLDTSLLERAIPTSALSVQPGLPVVRAVAAFYAPIAGVFSISEKTDTTYLPTSNTTVENTPVENLTSKLTTDWTFATGFYKPMEELWTTVQIFVEPGTQGMVLRGDFSLFSTREKMFDAKIELPTGWNVTQVTDTSDATRPPLPLAFETLEMDATTSAERCARLRILPPVSSDGKNRQPIAEQTLWKISLDAVASAEMRCVDRNDPMLAESDTNDSNIDPSSTTGDKTNGDKTVDDKPAGVGKIGNGIENKNREGAALSEAGRSEEFAYRFAVPEFHLCGATRESGAVAIGSRDDFSVRADGEVTSALIPLLDAEIAALGFRTNGVTPQLAWSYHQRTPLPQLVIEKVRSRSTARAFSFFRVEQERIAVHQELVWKIDQAKTSRLRFALPASSPAGVTISSPDASVAIRQYTSRIISNGSKLENEKENDSISNLDTDANSERLWEVETVNPVRGVVRLIVTFSIPQSNISQTESTVQALPLPTFPDAVHTSGLVAVEGDAELDTTVQTTARKIDIGELAEAESYLPGDRLIGAWSFVATPPTTQITMRRYPAFALVSAIAERLQLDLCMTDQVDGMLLAAADFTLRTTPQTLVLELPDGAELYAIHLDDRAMRPVAAQTDNATVGKCVSFLVDVTPIGTADDTAVPHDKAMNVPGDVLNNVSDNASNGASDNGLSGTVENGRSATASMELRKLRVVYGVPRSMCGENRGNDENNKNNADGTKSKGGLCERLKIAIPQIKLADGRVTPVLKANARILPPEETRVLNPFDEMPTETYGFVETSERLVRGIGQTLCVPFVLSKTVDRTTSPSAEMVLSDAATNAVAEECESTTSSMAVEMDDAKDASTVSRRALGQTLATKELASADELPATDTPMAKYLAESMDADDVGMDQMAPSGEMNQNAAMDQSAIMERRDIAADKTFERVEDHGIYREYGHARASDMAGRRGGRSEPRPAAGRESRTLGMRSLPIQWAMDDERVIELPLPTMIESPDETNAVGRITLPEMELLLIPNANVRFSAMEWIVGLGVLLVGMTVLRRGYGTQVLMLIVLWCVAVFLPCVYQLYTNIVTRASEGILHAQSPDQTVLLRGVATVIATATVLLLLVYLLRAAWIFVQMIAAKLVAECQRMKISRKKTESTANHGASADRVKDHGNGAGDTEGVQTMETIRTRRGSRLRLRILWWTLLTLVVILIVSVLCHSISAQEPELPPLTIPGDAIIVPYDPDATTILSDEQGKLRFVRPAVDENQTVLVPYADYRSMRERVQKNLDRLRDLVEPVQANMSHTANADVSVKPLPDGVPIVKANGENQYGVLAIRNTEYRVRTETSETLSVRGTFDVEILADNGDLIVPLPVVGSLIESVKVDGRTAPLVTLATSVPEPMVQQMANQAVMNAATPPVVPSASVGVRVCGRGVHPVELVLRFPVSRQGGVRVISGIVPIGAAAKLVIEVPEAGTTLSIGDESNGNLLRDNRETQGDHEQIITSLDTASVGPVTVVASASGSPAMQCGRLRIQWRPRVVTDAPMDAGLTVDSLMVINLTEDGTRLAWRATPSFRSGEYQQFRVEIPMDDVSDAKQWRVERVTGANVRVWDQRQDAQKIVVDVELLGVAKDSETFTVYLFRAAEFPSTASSQSASTLRTVPIPAIQGALRHVGQVTIRKSPQMVIQNVRFLGTEQIDFPAIPEDMLAAGETPLGVQNFQGYQFRSHPSTFTCETRRMEANRVANIDMEWRVTPCEAVVDATMHIWMADDQFHDFVVELPPGLKIDAVSATGDPQWCVEPAPLAAKNKLIDTAKCLLSKSGGISSEERKTIQKNLTASVDRLVFRFAHAPSSNIEVRLRGTFTQSMETDTAVTNATAWLLPWFRLLDTETPTNHTVVIQTDPSFETSWDTLHDSTFGASVWRAVDERQTTAQRSRLPAERATLMRDVLVGSGSKMDGQWIPPLGVVRLTPRKPIIDAVTLSNVRLTDRDVEETMLIDLAIQRAGVREIVFDLPERMSDARFQVPGLRRTVIEPIPQDENPSGHQTPTDDHLTPKGDTIGSNDIVEADDSTRLEDATDSSATEEPKWIRVRLELQDEVMGQVRVLVENDLPLAGEQRDVVFPRLRMPTQTLRRYALIENSGRDEMMIVDRRLLTPIDRRQEAWTRLVLLLGSEPVGAEAFVVVERNSSEKVESRMESSTPKSLSPLEPRLCVGTRRREQADWVDARIGLSETSLIVDAFGEYRARQIWNIDNSTRPFLEVELPAGATLWGVTVAGKPVKPIAVQTVQDAQNHGEQIRSENGGNGANKVTEENTKGNKVNNADDSTATPGTRVRFPLVKTSQGDPDYEVVAIYAGKLPAVRPGLPWIQRDSRTAFPLIRVHGIEVRRSNVKLFLPKNVQWFDFDGTLGQVDSADELLAQRIEYDTDQLQRLMLKRRESGDRMTQIRAEENLRILASQNSYHGTLFDGGSKSYRSDSLLDASSSTVPGGYSKGLQFIEKAVHYNEEIVSQVTEELGKASQETRDVPTETVDNRQKIYGAFANQSTQRALNVVAGLGTDMPEKPQNGGAEVTVQSQEVETWMRRNALESSSISNTQPAPPEAPSGGVVERKADEAFLGEAILEDGANTSNGPVQKREMNRLSKSKAALPLQMPQMGKPQTIVQNNASVLDVTKELGEKRSTQEESLRQTERYRGQVQQRAMSNRMNYVGNRDMDSASPTQVPRESREMSERNDHGRYDDKDNVVQNGRETNMPQDSLRRQNAMAPSGGAMGGMSGGMGGQEMGDGMGGESVPSFPSVSPQSPSDVDMPSFASDASITADRASSLLTSSGLASLMIRWDESELATDSHVIYFTTPGGDLSLEARGYPRNTFEPTPTMVATGSLGVLKHLFWLLAAIAIVHRYRVQKTRRTKDMI